MASLGKGVEKMRSEVKTLADDVRAIGGGAADHPRGSADGAALSRPSGTPGPSGA